jgi:FMNH2-dependent dimethyl sulfone monooxygenase
MVKIGLYLPVYGGWFPSRKSAKAEVDGIYFDKEDEKLPTYDYVKQVALEAEKIGIDSLWIPDHMLNPIKGESAPALEAWTLAAAIAEVTEKVVIAHTTLCEAFRYPAVLAKQAATLAEISKGRFWLSLGACWFKREFEAYGLPFYEHDERVDRAREAIQIIKRLWIEDRVTFKGKFYSIESGVLEPKPNPKPPIWYAGVSEASRNLVAEEVDGWLMRGFSVEEARRNVEDMYKRLDKVGRDKIEFAIPGLTFIRDTDEEAKKYLESIAGSRRNVLDRTLDTGLVGSPETVAQKIEQLKEVGMDHVLLQLTPTLAEMSYVKKVLEILKG